MKYIPDIETADKKYCFTDGVGTISPKYCKMVSLRKRFIVSMRYFNFISRSKKHWEDERCRVCYKSVMVVVRYEIFFSI